MKKIYLASPYSDPDPAIQEQRFLAVCKKAGELMNLGFLIYSPIAHSHPIAKLCNLPKDYKYWQKVNHEFIRWADEVWVLMLPGWDCSGGIKDELKFTDSLIKPVRYLVWDGKMVKSNDEGARLKRLLKLQKERDKIMEARWNNMFRDEG